MTDEQSEFSVIKFFKLFQASIKKIDTFPLSSENLIVQSDAYSRLFSEKENPDEPFASIGYFERKSDSDLLFNVLFTPIGFIVDAEFFGSYSLPYDDAELFNDEADLNSQLIGFLSRLANGQLRALITTYDDVPVACETLLYDNNYKHPIVTTTNAQYPRKVYDELFDFIISKNTFAIPPLPTPQKAFYIRYKENGKPARMGRVIQSSIEPLTKQQYNDTFEEIGYQAMGKKHDESEDSFFKRSWEIQVSYIGTAVIVLTLFILGLLPPIFNDSPGLLGVAVFVLAIPVATTLMIIKASKRLHQKPSLLLTVDDMFEKYNAKLLAKQKLKEAKMNKSKKVRKKPNHFFVKSIKQALYLSPACMIVSGYIFSATMPQNMMNIGSPLLLGTTISLLGVFILVFTDRYIRGAFALKSYEWSLIIFIAMALLSTIVLLKDEPVQGAALGWILLFASPGISIIVLFLEKVLNKPTTS